MKISSVSFSGVSVRHIAIDVLLLLVLCGIYMLLSAGALHVLARFIDPLSVDLDRYTSALNMIGSALFFVVFFYVFAVREQRGSMHLVLCGSIIFLMMGGWMEPMKNWLDELCVIILGVASSHAYALFLKRKDHA